jgi:two-component system, OmpR family, response regulator
MERDARRILFIEDDPETANRLADYLRTAGYDVDLAFDGDEGVTLGRAANYVVVIVDRMLPRIDGIEVVRRLRRDRIVTPTLIVSALSEIDDRVRGLRAGGDDYLVKPFALVELLARVDALARRNAAVARETILRVGDLEIDLLSRTVRRSGREIELRPKEFKLLEYLARNNAAGARLGFAF